MIKHLKRFYRTTCNRFCDIIPLKQRQKKIYPLLEFAKVEEEFDLWLGKRMIFVSLTGVIGFLIPLTLLRNLEFFSFLELPALLLVSIAMGIAFMALFSLLFYLHLYYTIEGRIALVEAILPDFLLLVASNINAGMTPFAAFRNSARKEFGPLSEEIKIATSKSLGTESFSQALKELSDRINSRHLREIISFFSQAQKSGGHLSKLLETSANDLRQMQEMKQELLSSTKMYVIFVAFVVVVGTPLLLAISVQFLSMISGIQAQSSFAGVESTSVAFLATELNVSTDFMRTVAFVLLFSNSLLASLFIGLLSTGKTKLGLKYFPGILVASLIVFFVSELLLGQFLGV